MKRKRFESFNKEFQLLASTLPMLVSVTRNPNDETEEQFITTHDHFITLQESIKDKLAAMETANKIQSIGKNQDLSLVQVSDIARAVRGYYFGEIKLEDFPKIFSKEMDVDFGKAQEISNAVIQKIINDESIEKQHQSQMKKLALTDALKKYPELGEQLVTSSHIKLKNFPDPVRPSIKNWLSDYTYSSGYNSHSSMDRGTYLFQNENTKKLSSYDRQRLGYILKTYDENGLVNVNETLKQIIFPEREPVQSAPRATFPAPETPKKPTYQPPKDIFERGREIVKKPQEKILETINRPPVRSMKISSLASKIDGEKIDFSSPHKFPYEKQKEEVKAVKEIVPNNTPQPMRITPRGFKRDMGMNSSPNAIAPSKNIVNLKE